MTIAQRAGMLGSSSSTRNRTRIVRYMPEARRVRRVAQPKSLTGQVTSFDGESGWGFIEGRDGQTYYLHRCEVHGGRMPKPGQRVNFFVGHSNQRARACYVVITD
jgi:cold shock CspA family protein